ncbi:M48 family metallopeptidase [Desulfatibacillum aliphaticivorans]|uniref:M48 family metallopeptidase n=1 Tax=Desulfatibacillum aliphaticivorans TaxID=218208 RepID=UPI0004287417|nr:M48 family metallopeptidase [Desulfatibacillum aliphaticivorans]
MFTNLILIIAVLVSYDYAPESRDLLLSQGKTWHIFFLAALFLVVARLRFKNFARRIPQRSKNRNLSVLDKLAVQQMLMAVVFFVTCLFLTPLKPFLLEIPLISKIPTLSALLALFIFLAFLIAVWHMAHPMYAKLGQTMVSRREYVRQQVMLVAPILIPWTGFYGVQDILLLIPSASWHAALMSAPGQLIYLFVMMTALVLLGPRIVLYFWGCAPVPPSPERDRMEALCRKANFTCAEILRWPLFGGHILTAAVFGIASRFRYILMTDAMLRMAAPDELDAVLSHEIGHAKKKHMLLFLLIVAAMAPAGYLVWSALEIPVLYLSTRFVPMSMKAEQYAWFLNLAQGLFLVTFAVLYLRFVFGYFLRNFERQADLYVYEVLPSALPLVTMFRKIAFFSGRSADEPNWHHFGLNQRIDYILKCESNRLWIDRHNAKVKKSLLILVAVFVGTLVAQGALAWNGFHNRVRLGVTLAALEARPDGMEELDKAPSLLGDMYLAANDIENAIDAYEKALQIHPDDAMALNNLAWTYATCEKEELRNPERALELALRAVEISPRPHILDTLAESYYVNSMYDKAVETQTRAIKAGPLSEELNDYQEHLDKYMQARDGN